MRTTTVVWRLPENPESATDEEKAGYQAKRDAMLAAAVGLAGEAYRDELFNEVSPDRTTITVKRAWPSLEIAQAWIALVNENSNNKLISAEVDPE